MRVTDARLGRFARGAPATRYAVIALDEALGADKAVYDHDSRSGLVGGVIFAAQKPTEKYMESVFADPGAGQRALLPHDDHERDGEPPVRWPSASRGTRPPCAAARRVWPTRRTLAREGRQDRVAMVSADELSPRLLRVYRRAGVVRGGGERRRGRARCAGGVRGGADRGAGGPAPGIGACDRRHALPGGRTSRIRSTSRWHGTAPVSGARSPTPCAGRTSLPRRSIASVCSIEESRLSATPAGRPLSPYSDPTCRPSCVRTRCSASPPRAAR